MGGGWPSGGGQEETGGRVAGDADFQQVLALLPEYEGMSLVEALDKFGWAGWDHLAHA